MDFECNYNKLLKQMNFKEGESLKHNIDKNSPLLPFTSRNPERVIFENGFKGILGELCRLELGKSLPKDFDENYLISNIINDEDVEYDDADKDYLMKLINELLFDKNNNLNILHPFLLRYLPLINNKRSKGEEKIAQFMFDVFLKDNKKFRNFISQDSSQNIIIALILKNIVELENNNVKPKYCIVLDNITMLFNEDFNFILNHKDFLLNNIETILAYYYFFYSTQLILKMRKHFNADIESIEPVYYLLEWEAISKNRQTKDLGYQLIKNQNRYSFTEMSILDQLNTLLGQNGLLLADLNDFYEELSDEEKGEVLKYLNLWITQYNEIRGIDDELLNYDFKGLVDSLFESLNSDEGIAKEVKSRYALNLEEIGKKYFLKRRGAYGYVLNVTRDLLIVITALCVKDEKMKLKELFKEYERRGLYFDKYSQEAIKNFFTELNLIDKKSDSGDAQYVKPIL